MSADGTTRELRGSLAPDERLPIGSVTKTITALLAARLSTDGVVSWDDTLDQMGSGGYPLVTLRAVLTHTAAVPFELSPSHWYGDSLTERELAGADAQPPRLRLPPNTWHYSNLGYAMAARHLERATGQSYVDLVTELVLKPLGMTRTSLPNESTEGPVFLGAAAPAGDLWSTLEDLTRLARAIGGAEPEVITRSMLVLMLGCGTPDRSGAFLGAGVRTHPVGLSRMLVSTGTMHDRTSCLAIWPGRGTTVLVAEAGYSHGSLQDLAACRWRTDDAPSRSWWWDGQEVVETRHGDHIELWVRETTWPFALFTGCATGQALVGVDWFGRPLELVAKGGSLVGPDMVLTADVSESAFAAAPLATRPVGGDLDV